MKGEAPSLKSLKPWEGGPTSRCRDTTRKKHVESRIYKLRLLISLSLTIARQSGRSFSWRVRQWHVSDPEEPLFSNLSIFVFVDGPDMLRPPIIIIIHWYEYPGYSISRVLRGALAAYLPGAFN